MPALSSSKGTAEKSKTTTSSPPSLSPFLQVTFFLSSISLDPRRPHRTLPSSGREDPALRRPRHRRPIQGRRHLAGPARLRPDLPAPRLRPSPEALPLLLYIHGGGFCLQSAFSRTYHDFVSTVAAEAGAIAVSVEYGLFPARPIPACYEDSWAALRWVAGHAGGDGAEPWLNQHADFGRVFIGGDSAGGNIPHTLAARVGSIGLPRGVKVVGVVLVHPFFGGTDDDEMWLYACQTNGGLTDPRLKPAKEDLARLGCEKVLVFVAEKDHLREVGVEYCEELKKSGWRGSVELVENVGEDHCFHLRDPKYDKAVELKDKIVSFIKHN
ncbi:hypothetical protein NL676_015627 [Syzygium grande]|nr:hypothetical protein NL676_015627 [Syzygium grande]